MIRKLAVAVLVLSGIGLTGCADVGQTSHEPGNGHRPTSSGAAVPGNAQPQEHPASARQYALVTEQHSRHLLASLIELQNANLCTLNRPGSPDLQTGYLTCASAVTKLSRTSSSLATSLVDAQQPADAAYVGTPSDKISGMVVQTVAAAKALHDAGVSAQVCVDATGLGCRGTLGDFARAMTRMNVRLVAWQPYL
jgi:hypothetical protein